MAEAALPGGKAHDVGRVAATVRRAGGHWTPAVPGLFRYLEAELPLVLGRAGSGDQLVHRGGDHHAASLTRVGLGWGTLVQAARLLRRYHDTLAAFPRAQPHWLGGPAGVAPNQLVCHNDFAPYHVVYRTAGLSV